MHQVCCITTAWEATKTLHRKRKGRTMVNFTVTQKYILGLNEYCWCVCRYDGRSFRDGVLSYNFPYTEQGALDAIKCRKQLEKEFYE